MKTVYFLLKQTVFLGFLKFIAEQNQLPIRFGTDLKYNKILNLINCVSFLICNKILWDRNTSQHTHKFLACNILLASKPQQIL